MIYDDDDLEACAWRAMELLERKLMKEKEQ